MQMKYFKSHKIALCDDQLTHMIPIPPAELPEIKAFPTITRLAFLQTKNEQVSNTCTQPMYSDITLVNQNSNSSPQNQNTHSHDQSTVISQQFSMITQELRNITDKMSDDINKITQACTTAQENTGKLIQNAILQALTKLQDIMPPNPAIDSRTFGMNCASNSSYKTNWTGSWQTNNFGIT